MAALTMLAILPGLVAEPHQASAQFDFFYRPSTPQRAPRPRRRPPPAPRPLPLPPRAGTGQLRPAPTFPLDAPHVETPLPPPRPHFPDDAPAASVTPVPEAGPPRAPAEMKKPAEPQKPSMKPSDTVKPSLPSRSAPETAPPEPPRGPVKPSSPRPPVIVQPVPDELPAKGPEAPPPGRPIAPSPREGAKPQTPAATTPAAPVQPSSAPTTPSAGTPPANPPLPPVKPPELTKPATAGVAPSGARLGEVPRQPEDDAACIDRLKTRNVTAEPTTIGPQPDERCTVVRPVRLVALSLPDGGKVEFPEHPTIACTTAETFSTYVRDLLAPLAKGSFGSTVTAVWTGPGLECRSRDHILGAKLSAHGQGLAIDIAQLKLADGRKIEVGDPKGDTGQAFESAARAGACGYFHTVLGPGSDSYHRTHWHFDLIVRGAQGDSKYCK